MGAELPAALSVDASAPQAGTRAALPAAVGSACEGSPLLWPIDPKAITVTVPFVVGSHPGLELAAPPGTPIYAAHSGAVQVWPGDRADPT